MLKLLLEQTLDPVAQENFQIISEFLNGINLLLTDFSFFEFRFTGTETNKKIKHNLGFRPKDVLQTSLIGTGTIAWNYANFTDESVDVTIAGTVSSSVPTIVRVFLGSYPN